MPVTRLFPGALLFACLLSAAPARADFNFGIYDGPAATDGRIGVTVKWTEQGDKGAESRQASVAIAVSKGDAKDTIRDRLKRALADESQIRAAFDISAESKFGLKCVKGAERKPSIRVTSVSIDDSNVENVRLIGALKQDELPRG